MADDSLARNQSAATASVDADYDAIYATVVASERGRWFLDEYARRHHGTDTERILAVLARVEQTVRGVGVPETADTMRDELVAMMEAIAIARDDVIGRAGDPAARGEAALADFRHAVEQIRELIPTTQQDATSAPEAQLSFQTNRLAVAGERLERSIGGVRVLLELLDELDQHLRQLVGEPRPVMDATAEPEQPPAPEPPSAEPEPVPVDAHPDTSAAQTAPRHEPFWDLTVGVPEPGRDHTTATDDLRPDIGVTDWAFMPRVATPEPAWETGRLRPPVDIPIERKPEASAASPTAALERLEVREFGRPPESAADATASTGGLDDLIVNPAPVPDGGAPAHASLDSEWIVPPAAAASVAEPVFDDGLLHTGNDSEAPPATSTETQPVERIEPSEFDDVSATAPESTPKNTPKNTPEQAAEHDVSLARGTLLPAMPVLPDFEPEAAAGTFERPPEDPGVDTASMLERLESMRTAIAELMEEVSEQTARRVPPR